MTEMEAIEQAVLAVEHSFRVGGTTVSLETCTIQDYTLVQVLSERKGIQDGLVVEYPGGRQAYSPPWKN
ncbi:hypothetical protein ACFSQ7_19380 [Paenibacillus rhizoplanae]